LTTTRLSQNELSRRWNISPRTLERWRWLKQGPDYLKLGTRVLYRLEDVEAFETTSRHRLAPEQLPIAPDPEANR
jgi:hypothetical protein